jgi:Na+/H+ antiporter NhaC
VIPRRSEVSDVIAPSGAVTGPIVSPGELLPYAIFAGILFMLLVYFVGAEEGAASAVSGSYVHEFVHDARHLLGFPCH